MSNSDYYRPFEKPLQHLGIDDWCSRTNHLCNLASAHRTDAFDLVQASRSVRNENHVQSHFNTTKNSIRLANRLSYLLLYLLFHIHFLHTETYDFPYRPSFLVVHYTTLLLSTSNSVRIITIPQRKSV